MAKPIVSYQKYQPKNQPIKTIILKHQPWMIWPNFGRRICQFWREMWRFSQPLFKPICFPPVPAPWPPSGVGALASAALGRLGQMASRWWLRPNRQPANCTLGPRELGMKKGAPGGWWYLGNGMSYYPVRGWFQPGNKDPGTLNNQDSMESKKVVFFRGSDETCIYICIYKYMYIYIYPPGNHHISHLGKRKIIFKDTLKNPKTGTC